MGFIQKKKVKHDQQVTSSTRPDPDEKSAMNVDLENRASQVSRNPYKGMYAHYREDGTLCLHEEEQKHNDPLMQILDNLLEKQAEKDAEENVEPTVVEADEVSIGKPSILEAIEDDDEAVLRSSNKKSVLENL